MTGTTVSAGKICARIDYGLLRPVATDVAEVLQTTIGAVASCNISQAGDYIVLQLAYRLKSVDEEQYHTVRTSSSFWAPLLSPAVVDPEPATVYWSRTLQLIASSIGISFLLVFVCCARLFSSSNDHLDDEMSSFDEYEVDDDARSPWEGYMYPGFGNKRSHRGVAFGSLKRIGSRGNSKVQLTSIVSKTGTPDSERLGLLSTPSQECDSSNASSPMSPGRRISMSGLIVAPANKLLQMATMSPSKKQQSPPTPSSRSFASSAATDATGGLPLGSTREVKALLEMQSVSGHDSAGRTALHIAASMPDITVVRALLDAEDGLADPRHTDFRGQTPVHIAASRGYDDAVAELVMFEYMVRQRPSSAESSSGRRRSSRLVSINQQDKGGNSPLHLAAGRGHLDVVRALERTSESWTWDLGAENNKGLTPLQLATHNGHIDVVMKLLQLNPKAAFPRSQSNATKKADASSDRATSSLTPLHIASMRGHVKLVRNLLEWMKEHEDLHDDSLEEDEFGSLASNIDLRKSTFSTGLQGISNSFNEMNGFATASASKLQSLVPWKMPANLSQDFEVEMSHLDFDGDEEVLLPVDDSEPLIRKPMPRAEASASPDSLAHVDDVHNNGKAVGKGSTVTPPAPKDAALQKKSKKAGAPSVAMPRLRVAVQAPDHRIAGSGSATTTIATSVHPSAGRRAGVKQASSGADQERAVARKGQSPKAPSNSPRAVRSPARQSKKA